MVNFPVFLQLDIKDYGLFPGVAEIEPGIHITFSPGLSLIIGANGLGKTTLITIIYRMLTGPYDIPGLSDNSDLGFARLTPKKRVASENKIFADRVVDNARSAVATLSFMLGDSKLTVERKLADLSLTRFSIDSETITSSNEETFQQEIQKLSNLISFGDWILILKYLVFYFEDRRALVWDPSAQRQILRILFLDSEIANKWTKEERNILELDSQWRNLKAVLGKLEQTLLEIEEKSKTGKNVKQELTQLESIQQQDIDLRDSLNAELLDADYMRQKVRLRFLTAEKNREEAYRTIERANLLAISKSFPSASETAKYILAQLFVDGKCIVCGNNAEHFAQELSTKLAKNECVICGSYISDDGSGDDDIQFGENIAELQAALQQAENYLSESRIELSNADRNYDEISEKFLDINNQLSDRMQKIERLRRELPPEEKDLSEKKAGLALFRVQYQKLQEELKTKRENLNRLMKDVNLRIALAKDNIKKAFDSYAEGFLIEHCQLIWSPQETTVGQTGMRIAFPAFELDMTGVNFPSPVRRSAPEQVSESQREFIDLAFRMALMATGNGNGSSLVMDAPESSLDAVFSSRAATVLSKYADPQLNNRLIITSNLTEGQLIPSLINKAMPRGQRNSRIVDLLLIAVPTAAVRERKQEYEAIRDKIINDFSKN